MAKRKRGGQTGTPMSWDSLRVSGISRQTAALRAERNRVSYLASEMGQGFTSTSILIRRKTDR